MHFIEDHAKRANIPVRFAASKIIEGDTLTLKALKLEENEIETIEHIILQMEKERGLDRNAAIADMRFNFIQRLCERTVVKPEESKEQRRSNKIDKVLTGKYTAVPAFLIIIGFIFFFTFFTVGAWLQDGFEELLNYGTERLGFLLENLNVNDVVRSLVIDGICAGVTTVLTFMPLIVILFFWLSMLEDTGYMARVAFVSDRLLRKIGLSGRSIVPMLIGFGCSVPAIMSTRTLPSARDRKLTILLTPFMSCTAKLPIYAFFCDRFFPENGSWVTVGLYVFGICTGILTALLIRGVSNWLCRTEGSSFFALHSSFLRGEPVPFVMELPSYRMPGMRNTLQLMWDKAKDFIQRAFTVIFLATIVIWFLQHFNWQLDMVSEEKSILASIGGVIAPVFSPLGLGNWKWVTALVSGFLAKESVVSTIEVLFSDAELMTTLTTVTSFVLLVFCLLYTPCVAAIATVRRELGAKWSFFMVCLQCLIAWIMAYLVKLILSSFV